MCTDSFADDYIFVDQLLKFDISSSTEDVQVQDSEVSKLEEQRSDTKSQT